MVRQVLWNHLYFLRRWPIFLDFAFDLLKPVFVLQRCCFVRRIICNFLNNLLLFGSSSFARSGAYSDLCRLTLGCYCFVFTIVLVIFCRFLIFIWIFGFRGLRLRFGLFQLHLSDMKLWGCVDFGHGVFIELLLVYFLFFRFASSFESGCGHLFALFFGQRRNLNLFLYLGLFLLDFLFFGLLFDLLVHLLDRGYGLFFVNFSFFAIMRVSFRFVCIDGVLLRSGSSSRFS